MNRARKLLQRSITTDLGDEHFAGYTYGGMQITVFKVR